MIVIEHELEGLFGNEITELKKFLKFNSIDFTAKRDKNTDRFFLEITNKGQEHNFATREDLQRLVDYLERKVQDLQAD